MKKDTATHLETEQLLEDARALLSATAHATEEKVVEARHRLNAAIEQGRETWGHVQQKAVAGAKAADEVIRDHPYQSIGVALGFGALVGYLLGRRNH